MSYGLSPFATSHAKTLIAVMDGLGDDSSTSIYEGREGEVTLLSRDQSCFDSLGQLFLYLSSSQGGWPPLSSEGRYMGAAAWGNMDRLTNPYYMALRELIHFAPQGKYFVNRRLANWHHAGSLAPYSRDLIDVIGEPILPKDMWDPDRVLNVDDIQHTPVTRDRVDKAAATQMLFEDVVFHVVRHWLIKTGATQLVLTGGTALNCVSNMRLLEKFDCKWYRRYLGRDEKLHLWVPPMPGDAGGPVGSAYHFAYLAGARPRATASKLQHAYYCGEATDESSMAHSLATEPDIGHRMIGDVCSDEQIRRVADIMAFVVSKGGVIGVFQGAAETGPRALGNRSILADPTNPSTLALLNSRVKHREAIRPLAPMATLEAAEKYFELSDGASDDTFNAFNYMVLAVQAKPIAIQEIPAVVHCDGTSRLQIVRAETNPLMHAYLQAMGNYVGAEVSVNTSLNVGSPIVQTPAQAFEAMRKSKGLHAIFMVSEEGVVRAAWHQVQTATKDDGEQLNAWLDEWHAKNCSQIVSYARTRVASAYTLSSSF
jgi:carbamoyltransferase